MIYTMRYKYNSYSLKSFNYQVSQHNGPFSFSIVLVLVFVSFKSMTHTILNVSNEFQLLLYPNLLYYFISFQFDFVMSNLCFVCSLSSFIFLVVHWVKKLHKTLQLYPRVWKICCKE